MVGVCVCVYTHTAVCSYVCMHVSVSVLVKHPGVPPLWSMGAIEIPFIIIIIVYDDLENPQ